MTLNLTQPIPLQTHVTLLEGSHENAAPVAESRSVLHPSKPENMLEYFWNVFFGWFIGWIWSG